MKLRSKLWSAALLLVAVLWSIAAFAKNTDQKIVVKDVGFSTPESTDSGLYTAL